MHNVPELTLAIIALDIGAPPAPPKQPTDPAEAIAACTGYRARCEQLLHQAHTADDRLEAQLWIDNADRQIERWQAALERQGRML